MPSSWTCQPQLIIYTPHKLLMMVNNLLAKAETQALREMEARTLQSFIAVIQIPLECLLLSLL